MPIKPLKDFLLLKPVEATTTASGLYVPTNSTEKIQKGEVVEIGPWLTRPDELSDYYVPVRGETTTIESVPRDGVRVFRVNVGSIQPDQVEQHIERVKKAIAEGRSLRYKVGDVVLYSVFGANELRENGQTYHLVPDKEVWAKLE